MNKIRKIAVASALVVLVLIVPIGYAQLFAGEARRLQSASIEDFLFEEIAFKNLKAELKLGGILVLPEGDGPHPGVVIVHGSGDSHRENRWYASLVKGLRDRGYAVLLPDKRGCGASEGNWRDTNFEDLATDSVAAVAYLRKRPECRADAVGILGVSQGGHIAPVIAGQLPDLAFIVDLCGSSLPTRDLLPYEERHNIQQMGVLPGLSHLIAQFSSFNIIHNAQAGFWSAIGDFDPLPYWRSMQVPILVLYGEQDTNIDTAASAARFATLDQPNIEVKIYAGSGHKLEDPEGQGNQILRADVLDDIDGFIRDSLD